MAEIIARFADGKLLVQENKVAETNEYTSGLGLPFRIGHVKTVEKIISLGAHMSGAPGEAGMVLTPLREAAISGDTIYVVMRRADIPQFLSGFMSGITDTRAYGVLSGITSGRGIGGELASGLLISGRMKVLANVIGF